jgi:hypothetical protein
VKSFTFFFGHYLFFLEPDPFTHIDPDFFFRISISNTVLFIHLFVGAFPLFLCFLWNRIHNRNKSSRINTDMRRYLCKKVKILRDLFCAIYFITYCMNFTGIPKTGLGLSTCLSFSHFKLVGIQQNFLPFSLFNALNGKTGTSLSFVLCSIQTVPNFSKECK